MAKNNGSGQSTPFEFSDIEKIAASMSKPHHQLIIRVGWFTGARVSEIVQLRIANCYDHLWKPLDTITFERESRKGQIEPLQQPIGDVLRYHLDNYSSQIKGKPLNAFLFPSPFMESRHISADAVDDVLRRQLRKLGWQNRGFSTHSWRRGRITALSEVGVPGRHIQLFVGHKSLETTQRYMDRAKIERSFRRIANL